MLVRSVEMCPGTTSELLHLRPRWFHAAGPSSAGWSPTFWRCDWRGLASVAGNDRRCSTLPRGSQRIFERRATDSNLQPSPFDNKRHTGAASKPTERAGLTAVHLESSVFALRTQQLLGLEAASLRRATASKLSSVAETLLCTNCNRQLVVAMLQYPLYHWCPLKR